MGGLGGILAAETVRWGRGSSEEGATEKKRKAGVRGSKEPRQRQWQRLAATGTPVKLQHARTHARTDRHAHGAHNCRSGSSPLASTVAQAGAATPEQDPGATEEGLRCARPADLGEVSQNLLT